MTETGFSAENAKRLAGITYRQLDHWAKTRLVGSSVRQAGGKGSRRAYSFQDVVALRVVAELRRAGLSLQSIRQAVEFLKRHAHKPLSTIHLFPHGNRVLVRTGDPGRHIDATAQGQVVISIGVEPIANDLRRQVAELSAPRHVSVRVRGRPYDVVLTPDLDAGGYTIAVPELPGCFSEADSVSEARQMVREAIELWLDVKEEVAPPARTASRRTR